MRNKKRIATSLLLLLLLIIPSFAHGGRTDANGGHKDNVNGDYHYHCNGHPAHQHYDGVCPYASNPSTTKYTTQYTYTTKRTTPKTQKENTPATTTTASTISRFESLTETAKENNINPKIENKKEPSGILVFLFAGILLGIGFLLGKGAIMGIGTIIKHFINKRKK